MMKNDVIYSVNGPVITVRNTDSFSMMEMVQVGEAKLIGEVIAVNEKYTTIQVYENTTGLTVGEPVFPTGAPLSATLGPGIMQNIFDGIERPLPGIAETCGAFIANGMEISALNEEKLWDVTMQVRVGDVLTGGAVIASCPETSAILHKSMVPPHLSGTVVFAAENGQYTIRETL
ncbi:MAG: V-type ATP synthase subunit A, partial [Oscillospiraceae bacterium]|nr:V-type ATP synthase subunit A [Oscillospiraceae bacterium]